MKKVYVICFIFFILFACGSKKTDINSKSSTPSAKDKISNKDSCDLSIEFNQKKFLYFLNEDIKLLKQTGGSKYESLDDKSLLDTIHIKIADGGNLSHKEQMNLLRLGMKRNIPEAYALYSRRLICGEGDNHYKGVLYLKKTIQMKSAIGYNILGWYYFMAGEYDEDISLLQKSSGLGSGGAAFVLYRLYDEGYFFELSMKKYIDKQKAKKYFQLAVKYKVPIALLLEAKNTSDNQRKYQLLIEAFEINQKAENFYNNIRTNFDIIQQLEKNFPNKWRDYKIKHGYDFQTSSSNSSK